MICGIKTHDNDYMTQLSQLIPEVMILIIMY